MTIRKTPQYSFVSSASVLTALAPKTIFAPAANTKGIKIVSGSAYEFISGAIGTAHFVIATSAPAAITDGLTVSTVTISPGSTNTGFSHKIPDDLFVPAGYGLYFIGTITTGATSIDVSYSDA